MVINNLETLKVVTDQKRLEILKAIEFKNRPLSVKEIAVALNVADPRSLYYHVNLLEQHEILVVAEKQIIGNMIEKKYHLKAYSFAIGHEMFSSDEREELFSITQTAILDEAKADLLDSYHKGLLTHNLENAFVGRSIAAIPADRVDEFRQKLHDLVFSLSTPRTVTDEKELEWYSVTAIFVPVDSKRDTVDFDSENDTYSGDNQDA
jgi:hypothetical protein